MKKLGKLNLISEERCDLPKCKCGWNLHIGGYDIKDIKKIKKFLKELK